MPANWIERINLAVDEQDLESLRRSVRRVRAFGLPKWQNEIAK
jgi:hypothetical protein